MFWPAGQITKMSIAQNVYQAFSQYRVAVGSTRFVEWTKENLPMWELVTAVKQLQASHD